jgi:hypothetical protein
VIRGNGQENWVSIEVRAKIRVGDTLEHMGPSFPNPVFALCSMRAADQRECLEAHEGDRVWVRMPAGAEAGDLLRKRIDV